MDPIYLDYNATTPIDPRVADAMIPWLRDSGGNPSSSHAWGLRARAAVDQARQQVAGLFGCDLDEIVFTSGGTEANNHAIKGTAWARRDLGRHLIVSAVDHPATLEPAAWLEREGWSVSVVPTDRNCVVDVAAFTAALRDDTVLASVMLANNETGVLEPVAELVVAAADHQAWIHTDCAQAAGKIPIDVHALDVDLASLASHKVYGPKGVGALFVRRGLQLENLMHGAGHENGRRAGTEAVASLVGLGEACRLAAGDVVEEGVRLGGLRDRLEVLLRGQEPDLVVHGANVERLPNTLSVSFPGVSAPQLLDSLGDQLAASAGAACHGSGGQVSGVMAAMGVPAAIAMGTVRLTVGRFSTADDVERGAGCLTEAAAALR